MSKSWRWEHPDGSALVLGWKRAFVSFDPNGRSKLICTGVTKLWCEVYARRAGFRRVRPAVSEASNAA